MGLSGERETRAVHVTLVAQTHVPDEVFETLREQFSDEEIAKLTLLVGTINLWNRMAISFRAVHPTNLVKASFELVANGELAAKQRRHTTGSLPPHVTRTSAIQPIPFFGLR